MLPCSGRRSGTTTAAGEGPSARFRAPGLGCSRVFVSGPGTDTKRAGDQISRELDSKMNN